MSLTDQIYHELMDGLEKGSDWQQFLAKHSASKGPLYNALGRVITEIQAKIRALSGDKAKLQEEVNQGELKLDSLNQRIKEAEGSLAPLEERRNVLNQQIETLETKLAEKSEFIKQVGELGKLSFDIGRLRQLGEALNEIGAKHGLKGKEAVTRFFEDLDNYGAVLEAQLQLEGLQTQIETKKLEVENWQAKEEALRRKHDDLREAIGGVHALRSRGIKVGQIVTWHQILSRVEAVERFNESLAQYADIAKLLNARKEEAESYELKLAKAGSEVEALEKERTKIEGAIDALKVAGVKEVKAAAEAIEKQLKAVAAREIEEIQTVGREAGNRFGSYLARLDELLEKVFEAGQEFERTRPELQKYEGVKQVLESHAVAMEEAK